MAVAAGARGVVIVGRLTGKDATEIAPRAASTIAAQSADGISLAILQCRHWSAPSARGVVTRNATVARGPWVDLDA